MSHATKRPAPKPGSTLLTLLFTLAFLGTLAYAQAGQDQSRKSPAVAKENTNSDLVAKAGEDTPESINYVEEIAKQGNVEAVPVLEKKFARTEDVIDKEHIASALVRLGDKKEVYWEFLVRQATAAIESGIPGLNGYDSQGNMVPGLSPQFTAWAQARHLSLVAAEEQSRLFFGAVMWLAVTRDWRAVPLLRQALSARNYMIQTAAAEGLAAIQDTESIPLIIDAVKKAPAEAGAVIARSLVYFDDPEAQAAVDKYVPKDSAKVLREDRARRGMKTPWD